MGREGEPAVRTAAAYLVTVQHQCVAIGVGQPNVVARPADPVLCGCDSSAENPGPAARSRPLTGSRSAAEAIESPAAEAAISASTTGLLIRSAKDQHDKPRTVSAPFPAKFLMQPMLQRKFPLRMEICGQPGLRLGSSIGIRCRGHDGGHAVVERGILPFRRQRRQTAAPRHRCWESSGRSAPAPAWSPTSASRDASPRRIVSQDRTRPRQAPR